MAGICLIRYYSNNREKVMIKMTNHAIVLSYEGSAIKQNLQSTKQSHHLPQCHRQQTFETQGTAAPSYSPVTLHSPCWRNSRRERARLLMV
jgi:hypothetical protein